MVKGNLSKDIEEKLLSLGAEIIDVGTITGQVRGG